MNPEKKLSQNIINDVSSYISKSGDARLKADVVMTAKHHILDTLAAMVSGSKLKPGLLAKAFISSQGGVPEAQVAGSSVVTSAVNAAFANGIMAHADETDDSHPASLTHPGCAIVPAALSMAERESADGMSFLRGVVAGYDIGCRITQALGVDNIFKMSREPHSIGSSFGAAAASASIARLNEELVGYALSFASQQTSGAGYVLRDQEHIEKALVFAGIPARNGVTAAILAQAGFNGVPDPFSGRDNFFNAFSSGSKPKLLTEGLGIRYEIMFTNIKKYSVGSPIQSPLEALFCLMNRHGFSAKDVRSIVIRLPSRLARVVDNREMPDINLQYSLAVGLLEGELTFANAHSYERMKDPVVFDVEKRITLIGDEELKKHESILEIAAKDGTLFREHVTTVRGMFENPLTTEEVGKKCNELMTPVLGEQRTKRLIEMIWNLEQVRNVREIGKLISVS